MSRVIRARILQVMPDSSPLSAGIFAAVEELSTHLRRLGYDVCFWTRRRGESRMASSVAIVRAAAKFRPELIHVHGLWTPEGYLAGGYARARGLPYVVSPRGMLMKNAFKIKRWKKQPYWAILERSFVRRAAAVHATSEAEEESVQTRLPGIRTVVLPNGTAFSESLETERPRPDFQYLFFLGRLHPIKNLESAIRAASVLPPGWQFVIAGDGSTQYGQYLRQISQESAPNCVLFLGRIEGPDKAYWLANAIALVLPSHSENFGNVVLEALRVGTPVIASRDTPWSCLEHSDAGKWVEADTATLKTCFSEVARHPSEWAARRPKARALAAEFSWDRIAGKFADFYEGIIRKA